jgi:phosphohistidine phosphatase
MLLLLIRHGHAVDDAPGLGDAGRWLTEKGRVATHRVARRVRKLKKLRPTAIWTSALVRSTQTAEVFAAGVKYEGEVQAVAELSPGRDPGDLVALLGATPMPGPLVLVGHEPALSQILRVLAGDTGIDSFKKSGLVAVDWDEGKGTVILALNPSDKPEKKANEKKIKKEEKKAKKAKVNEPDDAREPVLVDGK